MNLRNQKLKHRKALRILEMIEQETEKKELCEDTLRTAQHNGFTNLIYICTHKIEVCEMVIVRLNERYNKL